MIHPHNNLHRCARKMKRRPFNSQTPRSSVYHIMYTDSSASDVGTEPNHKSHCCAIVRSVERISGKPFWIHDRLFELSNKDLFKSKDLL